MSKVPAIAPPEFQEETYSLPWIFFTEVPFEKGKNYSYMTPEQFQLALDTVEAFKRTAARKRAGGAK